MEMPGATRVCKSNAVTKKRLMCLHSGKGVKDDMLAVVWKDGKTVYFHPDCYKVYLKWEEQNELEVGEWDALVNCVKDIHNTPELHPGFYTVLQDLRNGTVRLNGKGVQRYKQGVEYEVVREAYEMVRNSIKWSKSNVKFISLWGELMYCYKIMLPKIAEIFRRNERQKSQENARKAQENNDTANVVNTIIHNSDEQPVITAKKKPKVDISRFID